MLQTPDNPRIPETNMAGAVHSVLNKLLDSATSRTSLQESTTHHQELVQRSEGHRVPELSKRAIRQAMAGQKPDPDRLFEADTPITSSQEVEKVHTVHILVFYEVSPFAALNPFYKATARALSSWQTPQVQNATITLYPIYSRLDQLRLSPTPTAQVASIRDGKPTLEPLSLTAPDPPTYIAENWYESRNSIYTPLHELVQQAQQSTDVVIPLLITANNAVLAAIVNEENTKNSNQEIRLGLCTGSLRNFTVTTY